MVRAKYQNSDFWFVIGYLLWGGGVKSLPFKNKTLIFDTNSAISGQQIDIIFIYQQSMCDEFAFILKLAPTRVKAA